MTVSRARASVGGVLMSFVLAMVIGVTGVIAPGGGAALGASTTLTVIGGDVQLSRQGAPFEAATDGAVLSPGDIVRTAADARAVLTYFEGSTVSIEPSSELAIDEAGASPDGSTAVVMTQNLGRTWHVVTKLIAGGSKYEVRTPAATASVRGTAFEVGVARLANGETTTAIITTEGTVAATAPATAQEPQPEPVIVNAGFQTTARSTERRAEAPGRVPEPERKVTVVIGAENSLVVDPLGRANGLKNGKLVIQTPGARVERVEGKLVVSLPDLPGGRLSTVVGVVGTVGGGQSRADVDVVTTVQERGKAPVELTETVRAGDAPVSGVELRAASAETGPVLRALSAEEARSLPAAKVAADEPTPRTVFRPGLPDPAIVQRIAEERRAEPTASSDEARRRAGATAPAERRPAVPTGEPTPAGAPPPAAPAVEAPRGGGSAGGGATPEQIAPVQTPRGGFVPDLRLPQLPLPETLRPERQTATPRPDVRTDAPAPQRAPETARPETPSSTARPEVRTEAPRPGLPSLETARPDSTAGTPGPGLRSEAPRIPVTPAGTARPEARTETPVPTLRAAEPGPVETARPDVRQDAPAVERLQPPPASEAPQSTPRIERGQDTPRSEPLEPSRPQAQPTPEPPRAPSRFVPELQLPQLPGRTDPRSR